MALLARPGEIRFWLINKADDPDDAAEPDDLGPLVQAVKSGLGPDFRGPGSGPKVATSY